MKTLITASALMLASNVAFSGSFEEWQTDGNYNPVTLTEPMGGSSDYSASLDSFNEGNSDHSSHARDESIRSSSDAGFASSLDGFNQGNPDHV